MRLYADPVPYDGIYLVNGEIYFTPRYSVEGEPICRLRFLVNDATPIYSEDVWQGYYGYDDTVSLRAEAMYSFRAGDRVAMEATIKRGEGCMSPGNLKTTRVDGADNALRVDAGLGLEWAPTTISVSASKSPSESPSLSTWFCPYCGKRNRKDQLWCGAGEGAGGNGCEGSREGQ